MIEVTSNNVEYIRPLSDAEKKAHASWYSNLTEAQLLSLKMQRGGRFCVVQGDYSQRSTNNLADGLKHLRDIGCGRSPSARYLLSELVQRQRASFSGAPVGPDNGPAAA